MVGRKKKLRIVIETDLTESDYEVLKVLSDGRARTVKELMSETGLGPVGVEYSLKRLTSKGLVEEERENKFPFRRFIRITEKGREYLKVLELVIEFRKLKEELEKRGILRELTRD